MQTMSQGFLLNDNVRKQEDVMFEGEGEACKVAEAKKMTPPLHLTGF